MLLLCIVGLVVCFLFKQKTAYDLRISDWSSDVCSSDRNTDKAPSYGAAITELKREGKLDRETAHRQVKYLNNVIEADHGKLKILTKPVRGFKSIPTAYATIKGFEVMRALRKGQARPWCLQPGIRGEVRLVERAFGIGPRSEEHTSELQSLMRISYAVFCLKKKNKKKYLRHNYYHHKSY